MSDQKFHNAGLQPELVQASFIDVGDRGAAHGLQLSIDSPLNTRVAGATAGATTTACRKRSSPAWRGHFEHRRCAA